MDGIKHTFLVDGITGKCDTQNVLDSVGPEDDPDREIVVMKILYRPPIQRWPCRDRTPECGVRCRKGGK